MCFSVLLCTRFVLEYWFLEEEDTVQAHPLKKLVPSAHSVQVPGMIFLVSAPSRLEEHCRIKGAHITQTSTKLLQRPHNEGPLGQRLIATVTFQPRHQHWPEQEPAH